AAPRVLETFRDCPNCPDMVVIPSGDFMMGSPDTEADRNANEGPKRRVHVPQFAASRALITRGEWAAFTTATHRTKLWDDCRGAGGQHYTWREPGFAQGDDHPVVCINWNEAQDYLHW